MRERERKRDEDPLGLSFHRPLRDEGFGSGGEVLRMGQRRGSGSLRRPRTALEFRSGIRISPSPDHSEGSAEDGTFILITPFWPAQKWFASILLLKVVEVRKIPPSPPVIDLQTNERPLRHLPLLAWRIFGGCMDAISPTAPSDSSATVGGHRQQSDTTLPGRNSRIIFDPSEWISIMSI